MNQLTRIQILCFLRFSMPHLLIGIVLVGYSLYGLATIAPTPANLPWRPAIDPVLAFSLGTILGAVFCFFGVRSGLASIRYDGEDSDTAPKGRQ